MSSNTSIMRTKVPVRSDFDSDFDGNRVYPPGTPVVIVERLAGRKAIAEVRIPDDSLVGGARYDTVLVDMADLEE